jgi:hypothetical protein
MMTSIRRGASRLGESAAERARGIHSHAATAVGGWKARMDADSEAVNAGTRWGRGMAVIAPATAVAAALGMSIAGGSFAASFNVANVPMTAYVDRVDAHGLAAVIGSMDVKNADGSTTTQATLHAALTSGSLNGICAIVRQEILGVDYALVLRAATDGVASGSNIILDATEAEGENVNIKDVTIGRSADEISLNGQNLGGTPGGFGIDGTDTTAHLENVVATAYGAELVGALQASDFTAKVEKGDGKC